MKSTFAFSVVYKNLTMSVSGDIRMKGDAKGPHLTPHTIRDFLDKDCAELMRGWNFENLMKIRELVFRYIESMFKEFNVANVSACWRNGEEYLELG